MYKSIVIAGQIASGTSTAAHTIAQKLKLKYESAGDFFRKYVIDHNIPLHDKEQIPDELDREIDKKLASLAESGGYVIDAHYIGYFTKNARQVLKVLLTCSDRERFRRAQARTHTHTESSSDIKKREEGLDKKFRKLYADENFLNPKFFDLVIDTTKTSQENTANQIIGKFQSKTP